MDLSIIVEWFVFLSITIIFVLVLYLATMLEKEVGKLGRRAIKWKDTATQYKKAYNKIIDIINEEYFTYGTSADLHRIIIKIQKMG